MCHEIIKPFRTLGHPMPCSSRALFKHLMLNQVGQSPVYSVSNFSKDREGTGSVGPCSRLNNSSGDFLCVILPQIVPLPLNVLLWFLEKKYGSIFSIIPPQVGDNSSVVSSDVQSGLLVLPDISKGGFICHHGQWHSAVYWKGLSKIKLKKMVMLVLCSQKLPFFSLA